MWLRKLDGTRRANCRSLTGVNDSQAHNVEVTGSSPFRNQISLAVVLREDKAEIVDRGHPALTGRKSPLLRAV
jgi:hypothetical protein